MRRPAGEARSSALFPDDVPIVLNVVREAVGRDRPKPGPVQVLSGQFFSPHRAKPLAVCAKDTGMQCIHDTV